MGLSISLLSLTWIEVIRKNIVGLETIALFKSSGINPENAASNDSSKEIQKIALGCKSLEIEKNPKLEDENPMTELHEAAVKLQKVYKSYRTRRNLADCAVVVEELWWKALDFASLRRSSISFFDDEKPETAVSRWARARTMAAKVGKGLSKSNKAKKLALQHWLEAIDPRHRYGHNLHFYYDVWFKSESAQPFFYWLDIGDGREVNLHKIPRSILQSQCITYLGPNERNTYEVIVEDGKLVYKQSGIFVDTADGSKWIFVLSTMRALYVGKKKKGKFQHSSFLAGGAITAAGRLIVEDGILQVIWPYSGHYHPTEENFQEFIHYLEDNGVELTDVKRCALDDDSYSSCKNLNYMTSKTEEKETSAEEDNAAMSGAEEEEPHKDQHEARFNSKTNTFKSLSVKLGRERMTCNWTTGAGPRIGCVRDYPSNLQSKALEHVNLSPRFVTSINVNKGPIPSPRPSPGVMLSPRLASMGMPSPSNKSPTYQIHEELRSLQSLRNKRL